MKMKMKMVMKMKMFIMKNDDELLELDDEYREKKREADKFLLEKKRREKEIDLAD